MFAKHEHQKNETTSKWLTGVLVEKIEGWDTVYVLLYCTQNGFFLRRQPLYESSS